MSLVEDLLKKSASGNSADVSEFLLAMLQRSVFLVAKKSKEERIIIEGDGNSFESLGVILMENKDKKVIPCFLSQEGIHDWLNFSPPKIMEISFSRCLEICSEDVWLHLNPGGNLGKEFSPWEIERLRKGKEAVEEVAAEIASMDLPDANLSPFPVHHDRILMNLRVIFENFESIEEAFIGIIDADGQRSVPVLAYSACGLDEKQSMRLREKISYTLSDGLESDGLEGFAPVMIIDDLEKSDSMGLKLFYKEVPFYFRSQAKIPQPRTNLITWFFQSMWIFRK